MGRFARRRVFSYKEICPRKSFLLRRDLFQGEIFLLGESRLCVYYNPGRGRVQENIFNGGESGDIWVCSV